MAIAASAAAMVMINMVKKMPSNFSGYRYLLKTTKLMFTLFRISSIDISIVIRLRRVNKPYMPIKKRAVLTNNIWLTGIMKTPPNLLRQLAERLFEHALNIDYTFSSGFDFIAMTIQPIIAANNNMLTTSNGSAYPPSLVPIICEPILFTDQSNFLFLASKP